MKKFLQYILMAGALVALIFLLNTLHNRESLGMRLTHPQIITEGVIFVVLLSIALTMLLKRI